MKHRILFLFTGLLLLTGLSGCAPIKTAEYPGTWSPRITKSPEAECPDISGTYKMTNDQPMLPFLLYGIVDEDSPEWKHLVHIYEKYLLPDPSTAVVTIVYPDSEHIEVAMVIHGKTVAKQVLTRSSQSENNAVWFGQNSQSFRCESDSIVINSAYIHDWGVYTLTDEEKKRRYRRLHGAVGPLGVSEGFFYFSKTDDGHLVMRAHRYGCYPCQSLDEFWWQWESTNISTVQ